MIAQIFLYVKGFFEKNGGIFMLQTNMEIAQNIRALAKSRGVTVKQTLADCKINRNFIYDLEHGNSSPSVDKISRIADYFGVGTAALLGGEATDGAGQRGARVAEGGE